MPGQPAISGFRALLRFLRQAAAERALPPLAQAEAARDRRQGLGEDPGADRAIEASVEWLCEAQDRSTSADGGVARHFSLCDGWAPSYPETTGYIVPTMLACAAYFHRPELRDRARRMVDWLVSIQFPEGGFQGGVIGDATVVPVTFNTGQVLLGLAAAHAEFGHEYRSPMQSAAQWLVATQDSDGCWRRHPTPFATHGEKAYETHVAWGLLEADREMPGCGYAEAALRNVRWAVTRQRSNGWFDLCDLSDPTRPLTHTIGYVLRGVLEAYRTSRERFFLDAAVRTAEGILRAIRPDRRLPGRLDADWRGVVGWVCLTGNVQIATCLFMLFRVTGDCRYRDAALAANTFVRRTVAIDGPAATRGGVKGSFPVDGGYGRFMYLSWASKFLIDSNFAELVAQTPTESE